MLLRDMECSQCQLTRYFNLGGYVRLVKKLIWKDWKEVNLVVLELPFTQYFLLDLNSSFDILKCLLYLKMRQAHSRCSTNVYMHIHIVFSEIFCICYIYHRFFMYSMYKYVYYIYKMEGLVK